MSNRMMRKLAKGLFTLILLSIALMSKAQSSKTDSLISREWKLIAYEQGAKKVITPPKSDRMIFYSNHKVKSIEADHIQNGTWQYDTAKKMLTIIDTATKQKMILFVVALSETSFIVEAKDPAGVDIKIHMIPAVE